jgi:hypothetical protein
MNDIPADVRNCGFDGRFVDEGVFDFGRPRRAKRRAVEAFFDPKFSPLMVTFSQAWLHPARP